MADDEVPERADEGEPEDGAPGETSDLSRFAEIAEPWVVQAWKFWAGGIRSWTAIAAQVGKHRHTTKKAVLKYAAALAALYEDPNSDPRVELLEGLQQDLQRQFDIAVNATVVTVVGLDAQGLFREHRAPDWRTRSSAVRAMTEIRKTVAEVRGVVIRPGDTYNQFNMVAVGAGAIGPPPPELVTEDAIRMMLARERALPPGSPPTMEGEVGGNGHDGGDGNGDGGDA